MFTFSCYGLGQIAPVYVWVGANRSGFYKPFGVKAEETVSKVPPQKTEARRKLVLFSRRRIHPLTRTPEILRT
jgi:hypothetical protein